MEAYTRVKKDRNDEDIKDNEARTRCSSRLR
jgi:hypothetical protein